MSQLKRGMRIQNYLEQSPIFAISVAYQTIIPKINQRLNEDGFNLLQGLLLTALLFDERESVNPSRLAEVFQSSRGNISHILSDLEYRGLVRRLVNTQDARSFKIELKAEGRKKALSLIKFFDQIQDQLEKELGVQGCRRTVDSIWGLVGSVLHQ